MGIPGQSLDQKKAWAGSEPVTRVRYWVFKDLIFDKSRVEQRNRTWANPTLWAYSSVG